LALLALVVVGGIAIEWRLFELAEVEDGEDPFRLPIIEQDRLLLGDGGLLPTAYCLLPTAYCLLPIAYCLLPIAYCLLPSHSKELANRAPDISKFLKQVTLDQPG
jgi:hypothetical protein